MHPRHGEMASRGARRYPEALSLCTAVSISALLDVRGRRSAQGISFWWRGKDTGKMPAIRHWAGCIHFLCHATKMKYPERIVVQECRVVPKCSRHYSTFLDDDPLRVF